MIRILFMVLLSGLLNSCGVIQKSRYGNGLHIDLFSRTHHSFDSARLLELRTKYKKEVRERPSSVRDTLLPDCKPQFKETNDSLNGSKIIHEVQFTSITGDNEVSPEKNDSAFLKVDPFEFEPPLPYEDNKKELEDGGWEPHAAAAGYAWLGSFVLNIVGAILTGSSVVESLLIIGVIFSSLAFILLIAAFILAIIGLVNIRFAKAEGKKLKGAGVSIAIIALFVLGIFASIFFLVLLLLLI